MIISQFKNISHVITLKEVKLRKPYNGCTVVWQLLVNGEQVSPSFFSFDEAVEAYSAEVKEQLNNNMAR